MRRKRFSVEQIVVALVSLVSVLARESFYSCGRVEKVEIGETVEIASIHAGFVHLIENMVGCSKRLGEYPTLSARNLARRKPHDPSHC